MTTGSSDEGTPVVVDSTAVGYTEESYLALQDAIKRGVKSVTFQGRTVQYQDISQMLQALYDMRSSLDASTSTPQSMCTFARFSKD